MFVRVLLFVLGVLVGACSTSKGPVSPHVDDASVLRSKTVALVDEQRPYCSGVWVSPSVIVTAAHCVRRTTGIGATVEYVVSDDVFAPVAPAEDWSVLARRAHVLAVDEGNDLALLTAVRPPVHRIAVTSLGEILPGSPTQAMGHSLGLWWSYSRGDIAGLRDDDGTSLIQTTAPISPGNSGGGLFDTDGRLIGICTGFYPRGQNINMFVHRRHVDALVATAAAQ